MPGLVVLTVALDRKCDNRLIRIGLARVIWAARLLTWLRLRRRGPLRARVA
jgi:hypothetical protein